MKILNFGSMNLDYIYHVANFVQPGETLAAKRRDIVPGGKGLNQSLAVARAGEHIFHAGCVGTGGEGLKMLLEENGADTRYIRKTDEMQGHAVIQVTDRGENAILLYSGSNRKITEDLVEEILSDFGRGDILMLQNEISCILELIDRGYEKGMRIVLNPSPMDTDMKRADLGKISWLLVNEIELTQLTGERNPDAAAEKILAKNPKLGLLITLGEKGAVCYRYGCRYVQKAIPVEAVDTTAAGDTFTGYFIAGLAKGKTIEESMEQAAYASALCVTRKGASAAIPTIEEVENRRKR